jgi:hypothetical protein
MENYLFLALLAVVGLLRWLSQMAEDKRNAEAEKRAKGPAQNAPIPRAPATTEEERIRKFMEALGVPTSNAPPTTPPPAQAPPQAPPRRPKVMPVDPFPIPRPKTTPMPRPAAGPVAPPPLIPPAPSAVPTATSAAPPSPPPLPTRETTIFAEPPRRAAAVRRAAQEFDVYAVDEVIGDEDASLPEAGQLAQNRAGAAAGLAAQLGSAQGLRDAIVLREIFGPPRSMQPVDLTRAR